MITWICKACGKYKRFYPDTLRSGQIVYFCQYDIQAGKVRKIFRKGVILKIRKNILTILDQGSIFHYKSTQVYPVDAPAKFVYKIFGECRCVGN